MNSKTMVCPLNSSTTRLTSTGIGAADISKLKLARILTIGVRSTLGFHASANDPSYAK